MPAKIFLSYSHDEYDIMTQVRKALQQIENTDIRTDENIIPGQEWDKEIRVALQDAHIIAFLVSPKFIASRYVREVELQNTIQRYDSGDGVLIPVMLEELSEEDRKKFPLKKFDPLPVEDKRIKPIKSWDNPEDALENIRAGIERAVKHLQMSKKYNSVIIDGLRDQFLKAHYDSIFKDLRLIQPFLESLDPLLLTSYESLQADWKKNKMQLIRRARNAEDEQRDIINRLQDYINDLKAAVRE